MIELFEALKKNIERSNVQIAIVKTKRLFGSYWARV